MKLRFHYEMEIEIVSTEKKPTQTKGLIVLESTPQIRTIFTGGNKGTIRLPFPYFLNVIGYRFENGKYIYPGIYGAGLRVFFRPSRIEKYTDPVFLPPMDAGLYGLVCTPHNHDNMQFDDLPSLVNHVITLWWNTVHYARYESWKDMSIDETLAFKWSEERSFPTALKKTEDSGYGRGGYYPPDDSELIDDFWPPKPKSSIVAGIEALQKELQKNGFV